MNKHLIISLAAAMLALTAAQAQDDNGFDLSSQRKEKSDVLPVPGAKADHHGIVLNPTPQQFTVNAKGGKLDISRGFRVTAATASLRDAAACLPAAAKGVKLTIACGKGKGVKACSGAYTLQVTKGGIAITGYDDAGAYYGLQTLRQLLASEAAKGGTLPALSISDYPTLPVRGIVEGFYGEPWSHQVRLSLIQFMGQNKLNTYVYGPKDDPYHSSPNWRKPYPEKQAQNISELAEASRKARVDFVWGIHPGKDIKWNEEDYHNLLNKFEMMYALGVRSFAIHFDDIDGEGTNPVRQVELLNRLQREFVKAKGDVTPLIVCPTDYSQLWANPTENGMLAIYGRTLDPSIMVFWTGAVVCSDLTRETLDFVNARIKRPALYWWNFPVTDYARHIVMQGPTYGLDTSLGAEQTCGILSNPMENGEASKLALYGVADYCWNTHAYNPMDNWERGLAEVTPECVDAYRTFAIHSSDTETGYRRDESWETETYRLADYTQARYEALNTQLAHAATAPQALRSQCRNSKLMRELSPWLPEFEKLIARCTATNDIIRRYHNGAGVAELWPDYVANLMSADDILAYGRHKSGTLKLQPFYENAMDDLAEAFYQKLTGHISSACHPIGTYNNIHASQSKLMLDGDAKSYYHSGASQETGHWIGLDLGSVKSVRDVEIIQGRDSKDDVDFFDHCIVECSSDGQNWQPLTGELTGVYEIRWQGEPVQARYVRMRKLPSAKKSWCAVRSFTVNAGANPAQDGNLATYTRNYGATVYALQAGTSNVSIFMRPADGTAITLRQLDKQGKCLDQQTVTASAATISRQAGATAIEITGEADIFEIM